MILLGTGLLCLPFAVKDAGVNLLTAFFTATSATCVTGLILADTYSHWTTFGQAVILVLIQIGGIGFMTLCISAISLTRKKIGLTSRALMQNAISAPQIGGIVRMTKFIFIGTFAVEAVGALLLSFYFCPKLGLGRGIWFAVFHSISAFCNAGFDLMGSSEPFSSLTAQSANVYVNVIIMLLIIIGGLGFFVWRDILDTRFRFSRLNLQSKVVLTFSTILVFGGALLLFLLEFGGPAFEGRSVPEQILASLFQSVSARTAGFNTVDLSVMTGAGKFLMICLMLVGGSAGSTAGGIKTTTFAVLIFSVFSTFRHRKSIEAFGRRLEDDIARTASCIVIMYLTLACGSAMLISRLDGLPLIDALFESISAVATVGLTAGTTGALCTVSKLLLAFLMLFGRAGSLTFLLAFSSNNTAKVSSLPLEKIQLG